MQLGGTIFIQTLGFSMVTSCSVFYYFHFLVYIGYMSHFITKKMVLLKKEYQIE